MVREEGGGEGSWDSGRCRERRGEERKGRWRWRLRTEEDGVRRVRRQRTSSQEGRVREETMVVELGTQGGKEVGGCKKGVCETFEFRWSVESQKRLFIFFLGRAGCAGEAGTNNRV
jgi:hypothetical protein